MAETALERFIRYAKIDTQSQEGSDRYPSTEKQFDLLNLLVKEVKELGYKDVEIDNYGYVFATIPSNIPEGHPAFGKVPVIGFLAHVDTSPDSSGKDVKPQIIENYQGGDIVLPGDPSKVIKMSENKNLAKCIGHTIVTSDGTTLLGADDKAGVAAIMTLAQVLSENSSILHGDIRIGFTPDEEIGQGTKYFDIKKFGAKYAYTIDGDMPGELNKETFSANSAIITIEGRDIHPGMAKNIMVNSIRAMADIIAKLPRDMAPETTEKYEPYIHPHTAEGSVVKSTIKFLLRDFKTSGLDEQKRILESIIKEVQPLHPKAKFNLEIIEMYRNMREKLDENPLVLECLWEAAEQAGANPYWEPIRGGTDGSRLTEMGLPTPNIYAGGQNFHSVNEWLSVDAMNLTVKTLINLVQIWVKKSA
ncbi:peptidase T [Bacteroidetes/Chlorobi group bacterium ChocPot_Mid]|jgi:tripeptide aminopeptidase|nr:MAG: peptidase T [Bacteroidetes/Chlorobi group bacterium ChocPot_Mid]